MVMSCLFGFELDIRIPSKNGNKMRYSSWAIELELKGILPILDLVLSTLPLCW